MSSAAAAHPLTPADLETRLAALGIPVARLIAAARIGRSTWSDWRAGRTQPRPDRWAAAVAAFDVLVAGATPAPADVEPPAAGAEPVTLTGFSMSTGAPPSFTPIATAAPAGELVADCERARALIDLGRERLIRYSDALGEDAHLRQELDRADEARDAAVADLAALSAGTPRDLAAKASVILAGLGDRPTGWAEEMPDYIGLVRSLAVDAVRLGSPAADVPRGTLAADLAALAALTEEADRISRLAVDRYDRTASPEVPEALFSRSSDAMGFKARAQKRHDGRLWYPSWAVERMRAMTLEGAFVDPGGRDRQRRDEIVAAHDAWQAALKAASAASGLDAIEADGKACGERMLTLRDAILDRPARTLDDLLAKAAVFGWWFTDEGERASTAIAADRARMLVKGEGTMPLAMALGILADLVAMAEARGLTISAASGPTGAGVVEPPIARAAA